MLEVNTKSEESVSEPPMLTVCGAGIKTAGRKPKKNIGKKSRQNSCFLFFPTRHVDFSVHAHSNDIFMYEKKRLKFFSFQFFLLVQSAYFFANARTAGKYTLFWFVFHKLYQQIMHYSIVALDDCNI